MLDTLLTFIRSPPFSSLAFGSELFSSLVLHREFLLFLLSYLPSCASGHHPLPILTTFSTHGLLVNITFTSLYVLSFIECGYEPEVFSPAIGTIRYRDHGNLIKGDI